MKNKRQTFLENKSFALFRHLMCLHISLLETCVILKTFKKCYWRLNCINCRISLVEIGKPIKISLQLFGLITKLQSDGAQNHAFYV